MKVWEGWKHSARVTEQRMWQRVVHALRPRGIGQPAWGTLQDQRLAHSNISIKRTLKHKLDEDRLGPSQDTQDIVVMGDSLPSRMRSPGVVAVAPRPR